MMFKKMASSLFVVFLLMMPTSLIAEQKPDNPPTELEPIVFGFDFVPMVGTSSATKGNDLREVSINFIGYSGAVDGVELGFVGAIDRYYTQGLQLSGVGNLTLGPLDGVQIAGGANLTGSKTFTDRQFDVWKDWEATSVNGIQIAGGANIGLGGVSGAQVAGGTSISTGRVEGAQISGGANISADQFEGAQIAGGGNVANGSLKGVQVAGGGNIATGPVRGAQIAGGGNISASNVESAQIAGGLNIAAGTVDGLQIGAVNIAEKTDFSLGVLNILWGGRFHLDVWGDETGFTYAGIKNGGDHFHYIYYGGYRSLDPDAIDNPTLAAGIGLGAHLPLDQRWAIDLNLLTNAVASESDFDKYRQLTSLELVGLFEPVEGINIQFGPTYRILRNESVADETFGLVGEAQLDDNAELYGWPGFKIGLQFL